VELGIFTQYINADSIEKLADKVRSFGLTSVVLDTFPGLDIDYEHLDAAVCRRIRQAFDHSGVKIAAFGGYVNFVHPVHLERQSIQRQFAGMIRMCADIGIPMVCSEAGSYHPTGYLWDPANRTEQVFNMAVESIRPLAEYAKNNGVQICLEPYVMSMAYSAERLGHLVQAIGPDDVKVVLDPAGILTRATLQTDAQSPVVVKAFKHLAPYIGLVHVQDCRPAPEWNNHFEWLGAGKGLLDYELFMDSVIRVGYEGPLILEFLSEEDIPASMAYVQQHWKSAQSRALRS
jgi:sugar phosphate isomerase/epimerase